VIVQDIMTTGLVTVAPDDTLAHAANLLRQHQFHHLPVVHTVYLEQQPGEKKRKTHLILEGLLTSQDIDLVAALGEQNTDGATPAANWMERRVVEVMHRALMRVTPTTTVASAARMLVERNLNYLPVVEYDEVEQEGRATLVGLVTRSDLLIALARAMGSFEPGMQLDIKLPLGDTAALARTLSLASELHIKIRSIMAVPLSEGVPNMATLRLGTINPAPLLVRLQEEGIHYSFGNPLLENDSR
jgi:acetoin utilization protein AcuB